MIQSTASKGLRVWRHLDAEESLRRWRGASLAIVFTGMSDKRTKTVSVFVDESGSFDSSDIASRYYIVCMVFHDQDDDLSADITRLERLLSDLGQPLTCPVHAAPLVRREKEYATLDRRDREAIFYRMLSFVRKAAFSYKCFCVDKTFVTSTASIHDLLLRDMVEFLVAHAVLFNGYEAIKVYYDNGQSQITSLLKEAFAIYSAKTDFASDVHPARYRLFQAADMICTLELVLAKLSGGGRLTTSEERFFRRCPQVHAKCRQAV